MIDYVTLAKQLYKQEKQTSSRQASERTSAAIQGIIDIRQIDPLFKQEVADTRYLLEMIRRALMHEEEKLKEENILMREKIAMQIIQSFESLVIDRLNRLRDVMDQVGENFDLDQHRNHKQYYQTQLLHLLLECPFTDRAYHKPHGFSGDFKTINMVVEDNFYQGTSLFSKILQKWSAVAEPWGPSLRGRLKFLKTWLADRVNETTQRKKEIHILNLGAGGALEIQALLETNPAADQCRFHLVDFDPHAIRHCRERFNANIRYYHEEIGAFLTRACSEGFPVQDIVYTAGIFDYLDHSTATLMLQGMYQLLDKNGVLLAGNFKPPSCGKTMLWYTYEWPLVMRTEEELKSLGLLMPQSQVTIHEEETGVCLFLEMRSFSQGS